MSEKVTRRGFFGRIGVLAGVAAVAPLAVKAIAANPGTVTTTRTVAVSSGNFAKRLWPGISQMFSEVYDEEHETRSTEQ